LDVGLRAAMVGAVIIAHPLLGFVRVPPLISPYAHTPCAIVEPAPSFDPKLWTGRVILLRHFHIKQYPNVRLELPL
jgi:hypothetical protein